MRDVSATVPTGAMQAETATTMALAAESHVRGRVGISCGEHECVMVVRAKDKPAT
jgi:hypothetical protein